MSERRHNTQNRKWAREIIGLADDIGGQPSTRRAIKTISKLIRDNHLAPDPEPEPLKPRPPLPMRADFLKIDIGATTREDPGHQYSSSEIRTGFEFTTLQYLSLSVSDRTMMRDDAATRGYTHMAVYIRSANDIKIGHFDFYDDPEHVIKCLTELVADGLGPVVFLLDDEDREFNQNETLVLSAWKMEIPKWAHLCSVLVPGLECNEYWNDTSRAHMFHQLRLIVGPDAYIAAHYTSDKYYLYPEMDGILWQFAPWKHDANGKDIRPRRNGQANFADEITKTNKPVGHSRGWGSPCRQAIADGIDFFAGEWTQLVSDGEQWGIEQSEYIERALLQVYDGDKSRVGLMNGAVKR